MEPSTLLDREKEEQERQKVDAEFTAIVEQIGNIPRRIDEETLERIKNTPLGKPVGYQDQGYRHD